MRKNQRRLVVKWIMQKPFPSWPETRHAVLECGHVHNVGASTLTPKRMACQECGPARQTGEGK